MKKFMLVICCCLASISSVQAIDLSEVNWGEKLAFYLPNRLLDALDTFSFNLGLGPAVQARLMGTRYCDIGAGYNASTIRIFKDHNRQYGAGIDEGWYWSFVAIGEEEYRINDGTLLIDKYVESRTGVPMPTMRAYDYFDGPRDFWAIGGSLGLLLDGNLFIHPIEFVDFALGFLLIDIRNDDLDTDSIAY